MKKSDKVYVIGAGLAGCEAAYQLANKKIKVYATDYPEVSENFTITVKEVTVSYPNETKDGRKLVESGDLVDGSTVYFTGSVGADLLTAKGSQNSGKQNFGLVVDSVEDDKLVVGEGAGIFTVVKNKDNSYSFKNQAGKYISAVGSGKNGLVESASIDGKSSFNVQITNGVADVKCIDEEVDRNTLFINPNPSGDPIFGCYVPTQSYEKPRIYALDPEPVDAESIELDASEKVLVVGEEFTLEATVLPSWAKDKSVTWSAENKGVVSVENGVVKAIKEGVEVVTAKDVMGHEASCNVTVVSEIIHPESVTLNKETLALNIDDVYEELTATVAPEDSYDKSVTWSSDNEDVVVVENGKLECVGVGTAKITVTTVDGEKTDSCDVSVAAARSYPCL